MFDIRDFLIHRCFIYLGPGLRRAGHGPLPLAVHGLTDRREATLDAPANPAPDRTWQPGVMKVHLVDGTYELFRQHFGQAVRHEDPGPHAATIGMSSMLQLLQEGDARGRRASDHVIELPQRPVAGLQDQRGDAPEPCARPRCSRMRSVAMGVTTWAMVEPRPMTLASAAAVAAADDRVEQVIICTPDKDLGQCVVGSGSSSSTAARARCSTRRA